MAKRTGSHPDKALSALKVRQVSNPGKYADGNGLYLVVDTSGAKRWLLRVMVRGRRRDIGLGGLSLVSLAEARGLAIEYRKIARSGGDPLEERQNRKRVAPTFAEAAKTVHVEHKQTWKNAKHAQQWINTLETYAFPIIGEKRVDHIETSDILNVLGSIWLNKAETARRLKQRISVVMDWTKVAGFRSGDNPVIGVENGLPKQGIKQIHHKAMPYDEVPQFINRLRSSNTDGELARLALEFLILTASRTSEVLKAEWSEIDATDKIWTIPASRMKAGRAHRVPMAEHSVELLQRAKVLSCSDRFIFPGRSSDKPMSNMVFLTMLRRMNVPYTTHGFRSSFRDWVGETTSYPNDLAEMALAHTIKNKVEAAYRRGDLLERRRNLMEDWDCFLSGDAK